MSGEAKAATQYGDLKGTASVDGFDLGAFWNGIRGKAGIRAGYLPVGISLFYSAKENRPGKVHVFILAADYETLEEKNYAGVRNYARENGKVPVVEFRTELKLEDVLPHVKRLHLVLADRSTEDVPLMIVADDQGGPLPDGIDADDDTDGEGNED